MCQFEGDQARLLQSTLLPGPTLASGNLLAMQARDRGPGSGLPQQVGLMIHRLHPAG
jgi:hypothetical protein